MTLPRLYPIVDVALTEGFGLRPVAMAAAFLEAGVAILQWRLKSPWTRERLKEAKEAAALCRQAGAELVINDRADIARMVGAGLHVGQDDLPPGPARQVIGAGALLGFSTHNLAQLEASAGEPIDYAALGPIFATSSKQRPDPVVGLENLRAWRAHCHRPLVAIGGITLATAREVLAAGADSVAVIRDLFPEHPAAASVRRRAEEWLNQVG